jgi:hypothetical protein
VYKTAEEWTLETRLSWEEQKRCRRALVKLRVLKERRNGWIQAMEFQVAEDRLWELVGKVLSCGNQGKPDSRNQGKPDSHARASQKVSEITTEKNIAVAIASLKEKKQAKSNPFVTKKFSPKAANAQRARATRWPRSRGATKPPRRWKSGGRSMNNGGRRREDAQFAGNLGLAFPAGRLDAGYLGRLGDRVATQGRLAAGTGTALASRAGDNGEPKEVGQGSGGRA